MRLESDDFELFGLPRRFELDSAELNSRWRALQASAHPDKFASQGAAAQRVALQWAVRVNEAYQRLKDPLRRAAYLCELEGVAIDADTNTAMPASFLMQQLELREALDDAHSADRANAIADEVAAQRKAVLGRLRELLDEAHDAGAAAKEVRALMFLERFAADIERRLEAMEE